MINTVNASFFQPGLSDEKKAKALAKLSRGILERCHQEQCISCGKNLENRYQYALFFTFLYLDAFIALSPLIARELREAACHLPIQVLIEAFYEFLNVQKRFTVHFEEQINIQNGKVIAKFKKKKTTRTELIPLLQIAFEEEGFELYIKV